MTNIERCKLLISQAENFKDSVDSIDILITSHIVAAIDLIAIGDEFDDIRKKAGLIRQEMYNKSRNERDLYVQVSSIFCYGERPMF
ncbi:hypothetical protein [Sulfuricurvum sp.]|uniref:hypothetical protein n=1 Tax=Sulfuricurvum sp. TaxID=2025608 RepID=UPI0035624E46